ncbi:MAG: hypothetical protein WCT46_04695 [Candidatus Gracilibacteria bacterium]|jgi:hypothetical protein
MSDGGPGLKKPVYESVGDGRDRSLLHDTEFARELERLVIALVSWMGSTPGFSRQDLKNRQEYIALFDKVTDYRASGGDVSVLLRSESQKAVNTTDKSYYELLLALQEDFGLRVLPVTWDQASSLPPAYGPSL